MSSPKNEFAATLEPALHRADEWISSSVNAVESVCQDAGDELNSAIRRGKDFYNSINRRVGREVDDVNVIIHNNPYPTALIGIGAGVIIGYLIARRLNRGN